MTDKEKIHKEVERLMAELIQEKKKGYSSDVDDACILELQNVLTYIDSLPEEKKPIREYVSPENSTLGKLLKEMKDFSPQEDLGLSNEEYNDVVNELIFGKEELEVSVSPSVESNEVWNSETKTNVGEAMEELEEKIALYEKNHKKSVSNDLEEAARQYPSVICHISPQWKSEVENIFKAGAKWQKEQIMGAAIKGIARPLDDEVWCDGDEFPKNIQDGDKVKVLIIKEE